MRPVKIMEYIQFLLYKRVWNEWKKTRSLTEEQCRALDEDLDAPYGTARILAIDLNEDVNLCSFLEQEN